jgi:hypothetical protein
MVRNSKQAAAVDAPIASQLHIGHYWRHATAASLGNVAIYGEILRQRDIFVAGDVVEGSRVQPPRKAISY